MPAFKSKWTSVWQKMKDDHQKSMFIKKKWKIETREGWFDLFLWFHKQMDGKNEKFVCVWVERSTLFCSSAVNSCLGSDIRDASGFCTLFHSSQAEGES